MITTRKPSGSFSHPCDEGHDVLATESQIESKSVQKQYRHGTKEDIHCGSHHSSLPINPSSYNKPIKEMDTNTYLINPSSLPHPTVRKLCLKKDLKKKNLQDSETIQTQKNSYVSKILNSMPFTNYMNERRNTHADNLTNPELAQSCSRDNMHLQSEVDLISTSVSCDSSVSSLVSRPNFATSGALHKRRINLDNHQPPFPNRPDSSNKGNLERSQYTSSFFENDTIVGSDTGYDADTLSKQVAGSIGSSDISENSRASFPRYSVISPSCAKRNPLKSEASTIVTPFKTIPYVHSSYAAAAPIMLQDAKWMAILRHLMPEAYADARSLLKNAEKVDAKQKIRHKNASPTSTNKKPPTDKKMSLDPVQVMRWAENNPVIAAFGVCQNAIRRKDRSFSKEKIDTILDKGKKQPSHNVKLRREEQQLNHMAPTAEILKQSNDSSSFSPFSKSLPALEWDVFLDPVLVKQVHKAIQHVEKLNQAPSWRNINDETIMAANIEVDRQVSRLMSRLMLAHGSTTQLLTEAFGVARHYNFSSVVEQAESFRRAQQRRLTGDKFCPFACGSKSRYEDTTIDDSFIFESPSRDASIESIQYDDSSETVQEGRSANSTLSGGIFVERWLALFASALKMGSRNEELYSTINSEHFSDASLSRSRHSESSLRRSRSFQLVSSRFLRGGSNIDFDRLDENQSVVMDSFVETQGKEHDIAPQVCGLFLCLGMDDPGSLQADHGKTTMAESAKIIKKLLGANLKIIMDLKSRRVPPCVWARLIDNLSSRGLEIEGVGSFDVNELNSIGRFTCTPMTKILFLHSAGDLQRACHANLICRGATVYFNAGSLIWSKPKLYDAGFKCCTAGNNTLFYPVYSDGRTDFENPCPVSFQAYAFTRDEIIKSGEPIDCKATLEDYQRHFDLNIGLYIQECDIGRNTLDAMVRFVNGHCSIFSLGLAWGGINGRAISGVEGDGFSNQRFVGRDWDFDAEPTGQMQLLDESEGDNFFENIINSSCGRANSFYVT